jgi:hypothetical protein
VINTALGDLLVFTSLCFHHHLLAWHNSQAGVFDRAEQEQIENYQVNVCLTRRSGSIAAAKQLMAGAAAILQAGAAGVFVDNSGIAHGATDWFTLFNSADNGGVYWAFISTVRAEHEIHSLGMHILGFRDAAIPATGDQEFDYRTLHSFLGYTAFSGAKLEEGEMVGDAVLPTFRVYSQPHDRFPADVPMFNPYGEWRLEPVDVQQN